MRIPFFDLKRQYEGIGKEAEEAVAETRKPIEALGQDEEENEDVEVVEVPDEAAKKVDEEDDDE